MAITKEVVNDKVEIVSDFRHVQCREATVIKEDGVVISRNFRRYVLAPSKCVANEDGSFTHTDTDIDDETQEIQDICAAVWTDAVKAAWKTHEEAFLS